MKQKFISLALAVMLLLGAIANFELSLLGIVMTESFSNVK